MATEVTTPPPSAVKFSRYRSVRKAAAQRTEPPPLPIIPPNQHHNASDWDTRPGSLPLDNSPRSKKRRPGAAPLEDPFKTPPRSRTTSSTAPVTRSIPSQGAYRTGSSGPGKALQSSGEQDRRHDDRPVKMDKKSNQDGRTASEQIEGLVYPTKNTARYPATAPRKHTARHDTPSNEHAQPTKEAWYEPTPAKAKTSPLKDKFGIFTKRKAYKDTPPTSSGSDTNGSNRSKQKPLGIEPGGGGIVPNIDAPISAVNAGQRTVRVKWHEEYIDLPVNPDTTPHDLLSAVAQSSEHPIDPEKCLLYESFTQLGLERPVRGYEHIRNVMNSWDRDTQNGFIIVPAVNDDRDVGLEAKDVPSVQPEETSVSLYYSQKPGKWDKRWVTLRSDGQIHVAKKADAKAKDTMNTCHLSDFDIYHPKRKQKSKVLRPPKKHCFAVKSQQRSSIFMSTTNFVHFFATDDRHIAAQWYKAVQGWRSWYLIHRVGEAETHNAPHRTTSIRHHPSPQRASQDISGTRPVQAEVGVSPARNLPLREKRAPPVSFSNSGRNASLAHQRNSSGQLPQASPPDMSDAAFSPNSLLGRQYSIRQERARDGEARANTEATLHEEVASSSRHRHASQPPDDRGRTGRQASASTTKDAMRLERSPSLSHAPKPLLDFSSPEYREPPQHIKKGRGVKPEQVPQGGLVEVATSPEVAIPIPPSTSWRRPTTAKAEGAMQRTGTMSRPRSRPRNPFEDEEVPLAGLLARTRTSRGDAGHGHGAATGYRDGKEPLLDMREASQFAPNSLLAGVERAGTLKAV
ncbi:MAG: hypothetical protein M1817_000591 [Caeruleum heppii]|nr:MAG: hypothetical protein M1817_000591 [Caeruleum heppii]